MADKIMTSNEREMWRIVQRFMEATSANIDRLDAWLSGLDSAINRIEHALNPELKRPDQEQPGIAENEKAPDESEADIPSRHLDGWEQ